VLGDYTSSGGTVITGSPETDIDGKPVARVGDQATCPKHKGTFPIVSGDDSLIFEGSAAARHGDALACGCTLIAGKQSHVFIDAAGSGAPLAIAINTARIPHPLTASLVDKPAVCEECLLAGAQSGAPSWGADHAVRLG